jgi:hypothetical protein
VCNFGTCSVLDLLGLSKGLNVLVNPPEKMKKFLCLIAILALVSPCFAKPIRIMVFGDSLSWGFIPNEGRASERYPADSRWPDVLQKELGSLAEGAAASVLAAAYGPWDHPLPGWYVDANSLPQ